MFHLSYVVPIPIDESSERFLGHTNGVVLSLDCQDIDLRIFLRVQNHFDNVRFPAFVH